MKKLLLNLLLPLGFLASCTNVSNEKAQLAVAGLEKKSEIVREYLSPVKILWQSDETAETIKNSESLLNFPKHLPKRIRKNGIKLLTPSWKAILMN